MFKSKKHLVILAVLLVATMTIVAPAALAKSAQNNGTTGGSVAGDAPTALINASRMLGKAVFFWTAAEYLNENGFKGATCNIDLSNPELTARMGHARYMLSWAYSWFAEGKTTAAIGAAKEAFADAEWCKTFIENQIHVEWRSVGEFKQRKADKKTLIFGTDVFVCGGAAYDLASQGIEADVSIDKWLTSWDLSKYNVLIFDPEYRLYGAQTGTGIQPSGRYGGLSPEECAYLEPVLRSGQIGLVYMEPYCYSAYTEKGQIPFIQVDLSGHWVGDPMTINVVDPLSPIAQGLPASFDVRSYAEWDSLPLVPGQALISNVNTVGVTAGPTITTFNYGLGRVVLTAFDTMEGLDNPAIAQLMCNSNNWVKQ